MRAFEDRVKRPRLIPSPNSPKSVTARRENTREMHLIVAVVAGLVGPVPCGIGGARAAVRMAESFEGRLLQEMAQSFWKSKKDQLTAEVDARMREIDELQARSDRPS